MKKIISIIISLTMLLGLAACGTETATVQTDSSTTTSESNVSQEQKTTASNTEEDDLNSSKADGSSRSLVIYFSLPETDDPLHIPG